MDSEIFSSVSFLLLPLLDSTKEHFSPFSEVYGKPLSDKDRPSHGLYINSETPVMLLALAAQKLYVRVVGTNSLYQGRLQTGQPQPYSLAILSSIEIAVHGYKASISSIKHHGLFHE